MKNFRKRRHLGYQSIDIHRYHARRFWGDGFVKLLGIGGLTVRRLLGFVRLVLPYLIRDFRAGGLWRLTGLVGCGTGFSGFPGLRSLSLSDIAGRERRCGRRYHLIG